MSKAQTGTQTRLFLLLTPCCCQLGADVMPQVGYSPLDRVGHSKAQPVRSLTSSLPKRAHDNLPAPQCPVGQSCTNHPSPSQALLTQGHELVSPGKKEELGRR